MERTIQPPLIADREPLLSVDRGRCAGETRSPPRLLIWAKLLLRRNKVQLTPYVTLTGRRDTGLA
jgi:hypothetical protein